MLDRISYIRFPSYPKEALLNAFYDKPEDKTYLRVLAKWKEMIEDENIYGYEASLPTFPGKKRFFTITKSTRYPDTWQLTFHDADGPVMHEDYSDTHELAGHKMKELFHQLAQYSAGQEIIVKIHMSGKQEINQ